jgi:hypothetical protein
MIAASALRTDGAPRRFDPKYSTVNGLSWNEPDGLLIGFVTVVYLLCSCQFPKVVTRVCTLI